MRGQIADTLSSGGGQNESEHKEAYVRFRALVAAIVRMVPRRDTERTKISSFLTPARKKSLEGIPRVLGYDCSQGDRYLLGLDSLCVKWMDLAMVWLGLGTIVLFKRDWLVQNAIKSGDSFCGSLNIPQASEASRRIGGRIITTLVGMGLIFFGLVQVYASFKGWRYSSAY